MMRENKIKTSIKTCLQNNKRNRLQLTIGYDDWEGMKTHILLLTGRLLYYNNCNFCLHFQ